MEGKVDKQVAAPAATRTPNWQRAKQSLSESADGRVATAIARKGALGRSVGGQNVIPHTAVHLPS